MTRPSAYHSTVVLARRVDACLTDVYRALSEPGERKHILSFHDKVGLALVASDFRIGGQDIVVFGVQRHPRFQVHSRYLDIVPDSRIVASEGIFEGEIRLAAGLVTTEISSLGRGTQVKITVQTTWLDGGDAIEGADSYHGALLECLGKALGKTTWPR